MTPRPPAEKRDAAIIGTNSSSIVSKRSVERLYSTVPETQRFLRHFVAKPQRRSPLINRGYWLRMRAVEHAVHAFLGEAIPAGKSRVVINLGCGYDPLPFQCLVKGTPDPRLRFVDIDYADLIAVKSAVVARTPHLHSLLSHTVHHDPPAHHVHYESREYLALGCDLRDLWTLQQLFESHGLADAAVLFTAEVSLTYMDCKAVDALIEWTARLPDVRFSILEQFLPSGPEHPFARTMLKHFKSLTTPLKSVSTYPLLGNQVQRYASRGWASVEACNLSAFWGCVVSDTERRWVETVEPFDEWEEFFLFAQHYFILYASSPAPNQPGPFDGVKWKSGEHCCYPQRPSLSRASSSEDYRINSDFTAQFTANSSARRRFGAAAQYGRSSIVYHGGLGSTSRIDAPLLITESDTRGFSKHPGSPGIRVCHTMTEFSPGKILLVGGRTSPDKPLRDAYILENDRWRRVQDLPSGRYRHCATAVGNGRVLIFGGRGRENMLFNEWLLWTEEQGWQDLTPKGGTLPQGRFSSAICWTDRNWGVMIGGVDARSDVVDGLWRVELVDGESEETILVLKWSMLNILSKKSLWRRFGAQAVSIGGGRVLLIGGVTGGGLLDILDEVVECNVERLTVHATIPHYEAAQRPLLIGHSAARIGDRLIICGGGGVCFSFGGCFNDGIWSVERPSGTSQMPSWRFIEAGKDPSSTPKAIKATAASPSLGNPRSHSPSQMKEVKRTHISSREAFVSLVESSEPAILEGVEIGPCLQRWTADYLKASVGVERPVVVHAATSTSMSFHKKNFTYKTLPFGEFIDEAYAETPSQLLYLRSLSAANPAGAPANLTADFPNIAEDFILPPELALVAENAHSSPLRISSRDVGMWLHFDVMANVLCQVRGEKLVRLYPPEDVTRLSFPHGASSSTIADIFAAAASPAGTSPLDVTMRPGDVLFVPPLWPHAVRPLTPCIAVNVFWRNLPTDRYAAGKDVYGNRDLQAYENGRRAVARLKRDFDGLPRDAGVFYLRRLAKELEEAAATADNDDA